MEQKIIGTTTVFFTDRCREKNKGIFLNARIMQYQSKAGL